MSRRTFGKAALSAGLAAAAGGATARPEGAAAGTTAPAQSGLVEELEKQLAEPLRAQAKPLLKGALQAVRDASEARKKHALPENSEPCTRYVPSGPEVH